MCFCTWIFALELSNILRGYVGRLYLQVALLEASQEDSKYCFLQGCKFLDHFKGRLFCWSRKLGMQALHCNKALDANLEKLISSASYIYTENVMPFLHLETNSLVSAELHQWRGPCCLSCSLAKKFRSSTHYTSITSNQSQLQIHTLNTICMQCKPHWNNNRHKIHRGQYWKGSSEGQPFLSLSD